MSLKPIRSKHGGSHTVEHYLWTNIIQRCTNPKSPDWANYGGRGIAICPEWRADFAAFRAAVGCRPSSELTLERINNDGHYCPGNVVWATRTAQARNRRRRKDVGEASAPAKLTNARVTEIRTKYAAGGIGQRELGKAYGVSNMTIFNVIHRNAWKHVI